MVREGGRSPATGPSARRDASRRHTRAVREVPWRRRSRRSSSCAAAGGCTRTGRPSWTGPCGSPTPSSSAGATAGRRCCSALGVEPGDRVAYIAPNTLAQLESFYAVPQIGAVLVPINYRLTADDFAYIIGHCGAKVVCAHADYLDAIDGIRDQIPGVRTSSRWTEPAPAGSTTRGRRPIRRAFDRPADRRDRPPHDQLHQRHHRPAQGRDDHPPQRVHERGRHAGPRPHDRCGAVPVDPADVPRQRLDLRLDRHGGGRDPCVPAPRSIRRGSSTRSPPSGSRCCAPLRPC